MKNLSVFLAFAAALPLLSSPAAGALPTIQHSGSYSSLSTDWARIGNPVNAVLGPGVTQIWFSTDGITYASKTAAFEIQRTIISTTSKSDPSLQVILWTGLSAGSGPVATSTAPRTNNYSYKTTVGGAAIPIPLAIPNETGTVTYGTAPAATALTFNRPLRVVTLTLEGPSGNTDPAAAPDRGELLLMLMNNTGMDRLLTWGSTQFNLKPGSNLLRYDGQITNGFPTTAPSDFAGALFTDSTGRKGVYAVLETGLEGGVKWGTPPAVAPVSPATNQDQIEVLTASTATTGGTIAIRHPSGAVSLVGTPPLVPQTASNTTGGAVISNPTEPKPAQTTNNTTNQTTITTETQTPPATPAEKEAAINFCIENPDVLACTFECTSFGPCVIITKSKPL